MALREQVKELGPWRHDIDLGEFSTFDVAESIGPCVNLDHPQDRYRFLRQFFPDAAETVVDLGCNAGGMSFALERDDRDVTGVDCDINVARNDNDTEVNPLDQAQFCKDVLSSSVTLVETDVTEWLPRPNEYDVVLASAILYHVPHAEPDKRDVDAEMDFVSDCIKTARSRVVLETDSRQWLGPYAESVGANVVYDGLMRETPPSCRQVVVLDA